MDLLSQAQDTNVSVCSTVVLKKSELVSPTEVRVSPTKPCGKGSKRKQDELDEEEDDEEERQTWVEALTQ